ncbi:ATP-binding protein [Paraburkholderia sp. LEh10]|uniref:ATP-binding protein n=1 Tax=Paraburkholderia sp. LEh10 TaxID=2821353 RepID=UPI001AE8A3F2|nr:ATP-binding protein [Paraburkholderia sp. LEh10]MBP0594981.1 ATP-binding protein [Paraburkholderia sp. LEh10]
MLTAQKLSSSDVTISLPRRRIAIVDAQYVARDEDLGVDNPLIRALPPYLSVDSVQAAFRNTPKFNPDQRSASDNARILRVCTLNEYIELLRCHAPLIDSIFCNVTQGYFWRNPSDNLREYVQKRYFESMNGKIVPIVPFKPSHAAGVGLFGISGVGKTTSLNRILSFFPPVIRHPVGPVFSGICNLQVVWLKVDCPPDGSRKQLFRWMLQEFDQLLGRTSYSDEVPKTAGLDTLMNKAAAVAAYHHTGIIVIDESQFAAMGAGKHGDPLMDVFVTFSNVVGVPLVIAGTSKALQLFKESSFRLARRCSDRGSITFRNMAFNAEWDDFLKQLFKFQWIRNTCRISNTLRDVLYEHTQGIHALVIRLYQLAQIEAIRDGSEKLTAALLEDVAKNRFGPVIPMIDALKSRNPALIETYDDLLVETLAVLEDEVNQCSIDASVEKATRSRQRKDVQLSAVSELMAMKIPQSQANKAVNAALRDDPTLTGLPLTLAACRKVDIPHASPAQIQTPLPQQETLMEMLRGAASSEEVIERLRGAGLVE